VLVVPLFLERGALLCCPFPLPLPLLPIVDVAPLLLLVVDTLVVVVVVVVNIIVVVVDALKISRRILLIERGRDKVKTSLLFQNKGPSSLSFSLTVLFRVSFIFLNPIIICTQKTLLLLPY
jgi:hypothetical protein